MLKFAHLVVSMVIISEVKVIKGYGNIFPVDEMSDCKTRGLAAAQKKCGFDKACQSKRYKATIQECTVLGYDLIYQDSTFSMKSEYDAYGTAHCAIEKCFEGFLESKEGYAESFYSCLVAVKGCAKPNAVWQKYEL